MIMLFDMELDSVAEIIVALIAIVATYVLWNRSK
jgi:hypothetical protein